MTSVAGTFYLAETAGRENKEAVKNSLSMENELNVSRKREIFFA